MKMLCNNEKVLFLDFLILRLHISATTSRIAGVNGSRGKQSFNNKQSSTDTWIDK